MRACYNGVMSLPLQPPTAIVQVNYVHNITEGGLGRFALCSHIDFPPTSCSNRLHAADACQRLRHQTRCRLPCGARSLDIRRSRSGQGRYERRFLGFGPHMINAETP